MKTVYILLTRSNTIMSRMVRLFTHAHYTHASLSLSLSDALFYSFGRKNISRPLPAGFVKEPLAAGFFGAHPETECALLALPVEDDVYAMIERRLSNMERIAGIYRYNLLGALSPISGSRGAGNDIISAPSLSGMCWIGAVPLYCPSPPP